ncbi:MAG TPA: hypothetical protein VKU00_08580 [Chthonomonadaceae bacterium]|nr:hypothetical protein [Chthonomonadaceae bacterium]
MTWKLPGAVIMAAVALTLFAGCHSSRDQITDPQQEQKMVHVDALVKSSGGKWSNLSQADRDWIIQNVAHGQEMPAQMIFSSRAGIAGARHPVERK